jgi:hypothetical protein
VCSQLATKSAQPQDTHGSAPCSATSAISTSATTSRDLLMPTALEHFDLQYSRHHSPLSDDMLIKEEQAFVSSILGTPQSDSPQHQQQYPDFLRTHFHHHHHDTVLSDDVDTGSRDEVHAKRFALG